MRTTSIVDNKDWRPLTIKHEHDHMLKFDTHEIKTADGLSLISSNIQKDCEDITSDDYSNYILTKQSVLNNLMSIEMPLKKYPEQFTSYLITNGYPTIKNGSAYLYVYEKDERSDTRQYIFGKRSTDITIGDEIWPGVVKTTYLWDQDITDNAIYFSITLHDENRVSIKHNDNSNTTFLTFNGDPANDNFYIRFETAEFDIPNENQIFNYFINNDEGFILLYRDIGEEIYYFQPDSSQQGIFNAVNAKDYDTKTFPIQCVLRFKPYKKNSTISRLNNDWVSYKTVGNQNNLSINSVKSYKDVTNNFVLNSRFYNIDEDNLYTDLILLKNQVTTFGNVNRNNPFPNYRSVDHREYDKIHIAPTDGESSGLNLSYNSYETEITLPADSITYFNAPQSMYPYDKININDSSLISSGAIGGDTPITSDKIFKKAASYKYNTPHGTPTDEETGVWLCSWLKANIGVDWDRSTHYNENVIVNYKGIVYRCQIENSGRAPDIHPNEWIETDEPPPVWVDRYYNPKHFSALEALKLEGQYSEYKTKFDFIVDELNAHNDYIFDKKSDLTFEPGSLYAYYRIGPEQISIITENLAGSLIHTGVSPVLSQDRDIIPNINEDFTFTGDSFVQTSTPAVTKNSDFTISFYLKSDDWTKPFGGQILGNYTNQGIGIFNKQHTTPYIILQDENNTTVYNTDMREILNYPVSGNKSYTRLHGNEDMTIYTDTTGEKYDMKGMLVESTTPDLSGNKIVDSSIDNNYHYILDDQNNVWRFDISTERWDRLNRAYPYDIIIGSPEHGSDVGETYHRSETTFIQPAQDGVLQYVVNCENYTVDDYGQIWYTKNNEVWKYSLSNRSGSNANWSGTLGDPYDDFGQSDVVLMATENFNGSIGNNIKLYGDGVTNLYQLMLAWNEQNRSNTVELVRGDPVVIPEDGEQIFLEGGSDRGSSSLTLALSSQISVDGMKFDNYDDLYVCYDKKSIVKMDYYRRLKNKIDFSTIHEQLADITFDQICFDIVTEFNDERGFDEYLAVLLRETDSDTQTYFLKLSIQDLTLLSFESLSIPPSYNLNKQKHITNSENYRHITKEFINNNFLVFQMRYQSYFDSDKTSIVKLKTNVEHLAPGYHHFTYMFNSNNSNVTLFVDGDLADTKTSDDTASGAAYKFTKTIHNPLFIGTEPFFNNVTFSEHLKKTNYMFANGLSIDKVNVYNEHLNFQKVKMLYREGKPIESLILTLPTGKRNYIDHISKFYKHKLPGKKALKFNINIVNEGLSATEFQDYITDQIRESTNENLPVNTYVEKINWIS